MCELLLIGVSLFISIPRAMCELMQIWRETFHSSQFRAHSMSPELGWMKCLTSNLHMSTLEWSLLCTSLGSRFWLSNETRIWLEESSIKETFFNWRFLQSNCVFRLKVKILILGMCIKGIIQVWTLVLAYSATKNRDLQYDVFQLSDHVYLL